MSLANFSVCVDYNCRRNYFFYHCLKQHIHYIFSLNPYRSAWTNGFYWLEKKVIFEPFSIWVNRQPTMVVIEPFICSIQFHNSQMRLNETVETLKVLLIVFSIFHFKSWISINFNLEFEIRTKCEEFICVALTFMVRQSYVFCAGSFIFMDRPNDSVLWNATGTGKWFFTHS